LAPTGLAATPGNNQIALSWNGAAGATSYNVKRSTVNGGPYTTIASGVTTTAFTDSTAANGVTYFYVVSAVNTFGESADSSQVSATPQAPTAPLAPTALTARASGKKKINLTWTQSASANVTQNRIYRSTVNGGPYSLVATIAASTSFNNAGLNSGTTYYYVVTAVNGSGLESPASNPASATAR
jgi:cellulose 1,4-beta-cellobiosidase